MKYTRLTKEQFAALETEFINFLATQSITGPEWKRLKETQPELAEQELDIFSDLIWEGALNKAEYLQNISPQQLFLFQLEKTQMRLILIKVTDPSKDISTTEGIHWLQKNMGSDNVELFTSAKAYSEDRNKDVFGLIRQGAEITDGTLFKAFNAFVGE